MGTYYKQVDGVIKLVNANPKVHDDWDYYDGVALVGYTIDEVTGAIAAPTPPPKFATAVEAKQAMFDWAQAFTNQITTLVPDNEKHSWGNKNTVALDFLSGNANDFQKLLLDDEREFTGETQEELVAKIAHSAAFLARVASKMAGIRRSTNDLLDTVTDPYEYETILGAAQLKAVAALGSLSLDA